MKEPSVLTDTFFRHEVIVPAHDIQNGIYACIAWHTFTLPRESFFSGASGRSSGLDRAARCSLENFNSERPHMICEPCSLRQKATKVPARCSSSTAALAIRSGHTSIASPMVSAMPRFRCARASKVSSSWAAGTTRLGFVVDEFSPTETLLRSLWSQSMYASLLTLSAGR